MQSVHTPPTVAQLQKFRRHGHGAYKLAICGECGTVRQCRQPRNREHERNTGQLKCSHCEAITTHALITGFDYDETRYALALGMPDDRGNKSVAAMDAYRENFTTNPLLRHIWWTKDEREARERGEPRVRAFCGELTALPEVPRDNSFTGPAPAPAGDTLDGRSYDPDDVGEWRAMSCPNCHRVDAHLEAVSRRKALRQLMMTALAELLDAPRAHLYDPHSEALIDALRAVHGEVSQ
ncbi:hypothetical protein [Gordonia tangerina]|uniref:Uncharacterized protein n=1 Tax=Gordonia tangerina TaxID=2911060 RepID=A0ABS9DQP5_9ACTN|nr:hypothetical protein [Gordonia tangerina]MCF3940912.1 hypothetical protein [Gordonia tangerina]